MRETEFDERLNRIKNHINILFNSPLVQTQTIDKTKGGIRDVDNHFKQALSQIAVDIVQIEIGIKQYCRPKDWDLVQEGL